MGDELRHGKSVIDGVGSLWIALPLALSVLLSIPRIYWILPPAVGVVADFICHQSQPGGSGCLDLDVWPLSRGNLSLMEAGDMASSERLCRALLVKIDL